MKRIEIIALSVGDAREAEEGGAHRLELVRDLESGGLTPPLALVESVLSAVRIPVRVMLRENAGFGCEGELDQLTGLARQLGKLPIDGVVLGWLRDGALDTEVLDRLLPFFERVTFHRAFERAADAYALLAELKARPQIDRILTSGDATSLSRLARAASPEIQVIAGGGMTEERIAALARSTPLTEFHAGSAAREGGRVRAAQVRRLVQATNRVV